MENHISIREIDICKKCGKKFWVEATPQVPGFRWEEDEICPYCGNINRTSMTWEFYTEKYEASKSK